MSIKTHTKTLQVRIKDRHAAQLRQMARSVNFVWNYVNELSSRSIRERGVFLSNYDIHTYVNGAGKELGLHSQTVQGVADEYVVRRKQFKLARLRWRKSNGVSRSLGWIPYKAGAAQWLNGQVRYNGHFFKVWDSYGLSQYKFRAGSFSEDARGRFIREEMVNEWTTWRYRFGYDAFADEERFEQLENAEAEIWVAPERDNVPVRMRVRMVGQDVDERSGVLEIESEVQSIDEPVDIPLPPELEGEDMAPDQTPETTPDQTPDMDETPDATPESDQTPMAEAPALLTQRDISMIPEATDVQALANVVIFTVARSPEEVIQFYTDEMEAAGWQAGGETGETTAQFTRESESVSIVALQRPTGDQSTVIITIDNGT